MKAKIIRNDELESFETKDNKVTNILNAEIFSIAKVKKIGDDVKLGYETESDLAYYVLDGEGECVINGEKHYLKRGDCVFYPKGTKYKHGKGLTFLAIAVPAYNPNKRVYVE